MYKGETSRSALVQVFKTSIYNTYFKTIVEDINIETII